MIDDSYNFISPDFKWDCTDSFTFLKVAFPDVPIGWVNTTRALHIMRAAIENLGVPRDDFQIRLRVNLSDKLTYEIRCKREGDLAMIKLKFS